MSCLRSPRPNCGLAPALESGLSGMIAKNECGPNGSFDCSPGVTIHSLLPLRGLSFCARKLDLDLTVANRRCVGRHSAALSGSAGVAFLDGSMFISHQNFPRGRCVKNSLTEASFRLTPRWPTEFAHDLRGIQFQSWTLPRGMRTGPTGSRDSSSTSIEQPSNSCSSERLRAICSAASQARNGPGYIAPTASSMTRSAIVMTKKYRGMCVRLPLSA